VNTRATIEHAKTLLQNAQGWLDADITDIGMARENIISACDFLDRVQSPKSTFTARLLIEAREEIAPGCFQPYHYSIRVRIDDADWNFTPTAKSLLGTVIGAEWMLTEEVSK